MMMIIAGIFLGLALLYVVMILLFTAGWMRLEKFPGSSANPSARVTLIIPARNEERNILHCLDDILTQDFTRHLMEVIVVDDNSSDNTVAHVNRFISENPGLDLRIIRLDEYPGKKAGKKEAISLAIANSSGELIITTDADVKVGPSWISAICSYYEKFRPKMILGPVGFHHESSLFEHFQCLEFFGLMGVTGGSCAAGIPVMCNGANLAYERKAFDAVSGFSDNMGFSSGDDVFLMLKIRKEFGRKAIRFIRSEKCVVLTDAQPDLRSFFNQRLRWVSKSSGYKNFSILAVSMITYLFNLSLLAGIMIGIFRPPFLIFLLGLLVLKTAVEFPLVALTARFFRKTKYLHWFPLLQILNIIYVTLAGFFGNFLSFEWKGRKIRSRE